MKSWTADDFRQLDDGRWVVSRASFREYISRDGEPVEIDRDTYTLKDLVLKPECEDGLFRTDPESLPPGVLLQDLVSGLAYTIGEGPVSEESVSRIIDDTIRDFGVGPDRVEPQTPTNGGDAPAGTRPLLSRYGMRAASRPAPEEPPSLPAARWCLIVGLAVLVAALTTVMFFHGRRKSRRARNNT